MVVIWLVIPAQSRVKLYQAQSLYNKIYTTFRGGYFTSSLNNFFQCSDCPPAEKDFLNT